MSNTRSTLEGISSLLSIPGEIRQGEQQQQQRVTEQEMREFQLEQGREELGRKKISNALANAKDLLKVFERNIDKDALKTDPNSGITQMDNAREQMPLLDEAFNILNSPRGTVGVSVFDDGELGNLVERRISEENAENLAKLSGIPAAELLRDKGNFLQVVTPDPGSKNKGSVRIIEAKKREANFKQELEEKKITASEVGQAKADVRKTERAQVFLEGASDTFIKRPLVEAIKETVSNIPLIREQITNGNAFDNPQVIKRFIKTLESRITQKDYELQSGNPSAINTAGRFLTRVATGQFTKNDVKDMLGALVDIEAANKVLIQKEANAFATGRSKPFGLEDQEILDVIQGEIDEVIGVSGPTGLRSQLSPEQLSKLEAAEASGLVVTDEMIQAELNKRKQ